MFKAFFMGVVMLALAGGFVASEKVGWTTYTADEFVTECTKSTGDISTWVHDRNKRRGKKGHFSDGAMVSYVMKRVCECGRDGFKTELSSDQLPAAGRFFGLTVKADFARFADKEQQAEIGNELLQLLDENKSVAEDRENWIKTARNVSRTCKI